VRNGLLEAYPCTLDEALLLAADLPDVRIVQMLDSSFGADAIVARVDIPSLEGLRGRRVGYEATALGAYLLTRALQIAGLATDDVTPVFVGLDEHERALREGRVDAVVTYEPALGRLVAEGAHVLFDSTQIPGEIVDVLLVRGDVLDRRPDTLARVVTGWLRAASALRERPRESADALAPRLGVSVEQVPAAFATIRLSDLAENRKQILGTPPPIATAARRLMTTMLAAGILPRAPDVDRLFDGRVVARLSTPG
jgi:NitT/TauT family transport system substrate-binding protein